MTIDELRSLIEFLGKKECEYYSDYPIRKDLINLATKILGDKERIYQEEERIKRALWMIKIWRN